MKTLAHATMTPGSTIHVFEAAGLGCPPYRFTGLNKNIYQACPGAPIQPGGSCDYCGTALMNEFHFVSKDGKTFKVGCDCIRKTGDKGLRRVISMVEKEKRDLKAAENRKKEYAQKLALIESLKVALTDTVIESLKSLPHPMIPRYTLYDYVTFLMERGGISGVWKAKDYVVEHGGIVA